MTPLHLLFVYNANSDLFSTVTDFVHKMISPDTYACSLCALTYGNLGMKEEWKTFLEKLSFKKTFLHKDEFEKRVGYSVPLPTVFYLQESKLVMLLTPAEINDCRSIQELETVLLNKLESLKNSPA